MKTITLCFLLSFWFLPIVYGQEVYLNKKSRDTCLFLGGIADCQLKVVENGDIVFRKAEDLTQVGLLTGDEFVDELFRKNLCFQLDGYEPFWKVVIFGDNLTVWLPDDNGEKQYKICLQTNEEGLSPDFFAMFSTECGSIFGTINDIGITSEGEHRVCEYNISDEENSLYEAYVSIQGKAFKGCATIRKYNKEGENLLVVNITSPDINLPYGNGLVLNQFKDKWDFAGKSDEKSKDEADLDSLIYGLHSEIEKSSILAPPDNESMLRFIKDSIFYQREYILIDSCRFVKSSEIDFKTPFQVYSLLLHGKRYLENSEYEEEQIIELLITVNKGVIVDKLIISKITGNDLDRSMCFSYIDSSFIIHTKYFTHDEEREYSGLYKKYRISTDGKFIRYYEQNGYYTNEWEKGLVQNHTREGRWEDMNMNYIINSEYAGGLSVGEWKYYNIEQDYDDEGYVILSSRKKGKSYMIEKYKGGVLINRKTF